MNQTNSSYLRHRSNCASSISSYSGSCSSTGSSSSTSSSTSSSPKPPALIQPPSINSFQRRFNNMNPHPQPQPPPPSSSYHHQRFCLDRNPLTLIHHYTTANSCTNCENNNSTNNRTVMPYRPRALSASYNYNQRHQNLWGDRSSSIAVNNQPSNNRSSNNSNNINALNNNNQIIGRRGPVWQMSLPNDNDLVVTGGDYYNSGGGGNMMMAMQSAAVADSSAADYRLGRYFDSMNQQQQVQAAPATTNAPATTTGYRSISYQTVNNINNKPVLKPSTDSNVSAFDANDSRLKPVPRLPDTLDTGLPVIRPNRSDSVRSTDSRTTTASTASTLVPTSTANSRLEPVTAAATAPIQQQPDDQISSNCRSSSLRLNNGNNSSQVKKNGGNGGANNPNVRRVRFADEPPAEYTLDNESNDSRGATPPGGAIVVVTKRLGPSLSLPPNMPSASSQQISQPPPGPSSIMSMSINRVPPPYPHHRASSNGGGQNSSQVAEQNQQDWRPPRAPPQNSLLTGPTQVVAASNGDYADDGYDSVNQTPSEGSVNSTTSSSGLPQSASPDHQNLDSSSVDLLPPIATRNVPPLSNNYANYPPQPSASSGNYAYLKPQPQRPPASLLSSSLPPRYSTSEIYSSPPISGYPISQVYAPSSSFAQPQSPYLSSRVPHLPSSSSTLNLLPAPTSSSLSSQSQYRWLPGRSPSSAFSASTASLYTPTNSHQTPYISSTLTRPYTTSTTGSMSGFYAPQLVRAPSFRQLSGPEPVCIVAEHEFSSLLDSLPLGVLNRPHHL